MLRFVSACTGAGIDFWCYSGGSGLETAAYLHACAAHPHIREPNQSLLRQQPHDVIAEGPFSPKNNHVALPKGPGLGVTLDADRIAYCARLLVENGVPNKYHDPAAPGQMRRMRRMPLVQAFWASQGGRIGGQTPGAAGAGATLCPAVTGEVLS
ncbi:enolase C-terminal domain-like protein [Cypionkella sp.]|uniref:enolase C-terminal domain-like protein n=1 Tax=Cypionkella sp. TaxID=2811411 RepID=UPI00271D0A98|nr:enolase C-terminal domain-like protein [Cypionkella sp.]MDO8984636.1 enolase C-terminal domain-like protein [Cypionkella sp.]MDP1576898.1 enolase C-terminal domain-like protein [Cypionkella sp.]MDP2051144.1 enolase C-terminal domain-like protein [Cypionkella sp.]